MELPLGLMVILFFVALPLIGLVAIGLRVACVHLICYQATRAAAVAQIHSQAVSAAFTTVSGMSFNFPGIDFSQFNPDVDVLVYQTPLDGSTGPVVFNTNNQPNPGKYIYQYAITVPGNVEPYIPCLCGFLSIPGWTSSVPVNVTMCAYCENPQGLTQ